MKIVDLKATTVKGYHGIGPYKIIRIDTDEGIYGYGEATWGPKGPLPRDYVLALKPYIVGQDPRDVEAVMMRIRHMGGFGGLGAHVSAVSMALWDIAGKAAGLPVYRLLGGKIRDKVRIYCDCGSGVCLDPDNPASAYSPEAYAQRARSRKDLPEGYTILKFDLGVHGGFPSPHLFNVPGGLYETDDSYPYRGHAAERGLKAEIACVEAIKEVLGEEIGLALDCGPGQSLPASISLVQALESFNVVWAEDLIQGAEDPYVDAEAHRLLTASTSTPILTGENVYLRQGFKRLIDQHAVDIVSPDIQNVGGLAEAKWVAEFADLYGLLVAPHNANLAISFMANVHVAAAMPRNFLAFEFHATDVSWWEDMVTGVEKPLIKEGFATVSDRPGLGIELNEDIVRQHLVEGETYFE